MTKERQYEIEAEMKRRLNLWMENSNFNEMTVNGSLLRFDMALGMMEGGYPFEFESWMNENDFKGFLTLKEFTSREYIAILHRLFHTQLKMSEREN